MSFKVVLTALILFLVLPPTVTKEDCLYTLLGVSRSASIQEIKRAYRRKALDTHPDKNPNQQEASETFRRVVDAFEVLSDPQARRRYDTTGKTTSQQQEPNGWHPFAWHFQQQQRRRNHYPPKPKLKDSQKVKEAKLRVMHVVSMAQLETVMLDTDNNKLERHLLMCFITPSSEFIMEDIILFPYPFAGMSSQGIWWEDVLQTAIVRHHTMNHEIVQHFGIPKSTTDTPVFVFVKRGASLHPNQHIATFTTDNRIDFETWVWKQLEVRVEFHNRHSHDVELYWIDGTRANLKATIPPSHTHAETTMLSHYYVARDARVDQFHDSPGRYKLMPNALLGNWTITSTTPTFLQIETKPCMDWSGHCAFWSVNPPGECARNRGFMHEKCPLTCGVCNNDDDDDDENHSNNATAAENGGGKDEL